MLSAIEQITLLAAAVNDEEIARFTRGVHQLGNEVISIVAIVEAALAEIGADPELRADLEEMRAAAIRASTKIAELDRRTDGRPMLRLVPV